MKTKNHSHVTISPLLVHLLCTDIGSLDTFRKGEKPLRSESGDLEESPQDNLSLAKFSDPSRLNFFLFLE